MGKVRKGYPSDVTEEEWWFVLSYLLLCREDAGQREHDLRNVFNAVRYMARSGCSWRLIPNDAPPWAAAHQQFRRWLDAGVFEALVSGVQLIAREARRKGRRGLREEICRRNRPNNPTRTHFISSPVDFVDKCLPSVHVRFASSELTSCLSAGKDELA